jgi:ABC-2 type transport system ATP-binding protein
VHAIEINDVSKRFARQLAVDGLSLQIEQGAVFGLLGPNGAGKTTTIRMIVDIYAPDSGTIRVLGEAPGPRVRQRIGYLPEERGLYDRMTVIDELRFFAELRGVASADAEKRIDDWLQRLEIESFRAKTVGDLSKGSQQKIQFIVAVLHDPDLLILDEPFSGLDPVSVNVMKAAIAELRRQGKTVIFSTHQMEQVEQLCDGLCLIDRGRQVLAGSVREVRQSNPQRLLRMAFEGRDSFLAQFPAERLNRLPSHYELMLEREGESQELLRAAVASGARVTRFELAEASLHDIFVQNVRGSHA